MSSPLPLRLWCLAAMAPALTEATPQARVKKQAVAPGIPSTVPLVNGHSTQFSTSEVLPIKVPLDVNITSKNLVTVSRDITHTTNPSRTPKVVQKPGAHLGQGFFSSALVTNGGLVSETQSLLGKVGAQGMNCSAAGDAALKQNGTTRPVTGIQLNGSTVRASTSTMGFKIPPQKPPASPTPMGSTVEDSSLHIQEVGDSLLASSAGTQLVSSGMADVGVLRNVDLVAETSQRQHDMERRMDRLMRRLRGLQSRQAVKHTKDQLSMFVDYQHSNLQSIAHSMKSPPAGVDLKAGVLQKEDAKNLSTAALVNLVRRLQSAQAMNFRQQTTSPPAPASVLKLNQDHCREMQRVSGTLQMSLHHLENAVDSDATESSSGGESCDEDYDYIGEKISRPSLTRRCEWRFGSERAAVAARWTWLQAQVSDLEYRIRQQTEIYRQIRVAKGAVVLGEAPPPHEHLAKAARAGRKLTPLEEKIALLERKNIEMSPCNLSTLLSNVDKQSMRLTQQLGNVYSPQASPLVTQLPSKVAGTPNGLMDHSGLHPGTSATPEGSDTETGEDGRPRRPSGTGNLRFDPPSPVIDSSCTAARCQPVKSYGKRKLLRTAGLYQVSRKAARLSTVRCGCYPPTTPCTLCGGRYNNSQTVDTHWTPLPERVAILDPSFHSVLSFKEDVPLPLHFESLLKTGDWEHKPAPSRLMKPLPTPPRRPPKRDVRRYNKRLNKSASAALISSKIKSKYEQKSLPRVMSASAVTKLDANSIKRSAALRKNRRLFGAGSSRSNNLSSRSLSSLSASCPSSTLREMKDSLRRRRGESAFDINNIVIPYSMAASTRVEKLKYKDIITPKWRELTAEELARLRSGLQLASSVAASPEVVADIAAPLTPPPALPVPSEMTPEPANSLPPGVKIVEDPDQLPILAEKTKDCEMEDISEEAFAERHMRCEVAERKRFSSVITKKRAGRGARSDSTASAASAPTPTVELTTVEFEPTPSALQTPPGTPAPPDLPLNDDLPRRSNSISSRLDDFMGTGFPRRSGSFSRQRQRSGSLSLSESHDEPEVSPWERRTFPLCDSDLTQLKLDSVEEPVRVLRPPPPAPSHAVMAAEAATPDSGAVSPTPSSSSSDMIAEEDPDDPEWTVVGSEPQPKPRPNTGIVLKLAKR